MLEDSVTPRLDILRRSEAQIYSLDSAEDPSLSQSAIEVTQDNSLKINRVTVPFARDQLKVQKVNIPYHQMQKTVEKRHVVIKKVDMS